MPISDEDRSAAVVVQLWVDFPECTLGREEIPDCAVQVISECCETLHRVEQGRLVDSQECGHGINGLPIFLQRNESASRMTSSGKRSVWNAFCSTATIPTSKATSLLRCEERWFSGGDRAGYCGPVRAAAIDARGSLASMTTFPRVGAPGQAHG